MEFIKELNKMIEVSKEASKLILDIYHKGFHIEIKEDNSPVTEADKNSDVLIRNALKKEFPSYKFLTEESVDDKSRLQSLFVFIVDPLDGTKDFVEKDGEFSINIALCYKNEIVASVTTIPTLNYIYYALKGYGAYKLDLNTNQTVRINVNNKLSDLTVLKSKFHSVEKEDEVYLKYKDVIKEVKNAGSSYKACLIAEGKAELSYRLSKGTKERDTASFTLLVEEAGGFVRNLDKSRIKYNREDVYNDYYLIGNNLKNWYL